MSLLRQAKSSGQQVLEAIRQASYCPSSFDSSDSLSPAPPNIPASQYHVTLTLTEYDALRRFASIDVSSSASLALLLAPSTLGTSTLLASSSPLWIIDSRASYHMTKTSLLLSSYHPTPSHPPVTIVNGRPYPVQGCGTTRVTPSLSLH